MMSFTDLASVPTYPPEPFTDRLRLAVAAYLARFKGSSREHTESDLRCYLPWCAERGLDPLAVRRPHLELYIRWMQEIRRFKPSTVSRRFSVAAGFYRTCVLDGILEHSPAEYVRRPSVPAESPTLGFTHLQFEALLAAARESPNPYDFALVAMLGLLGLRIFEATSADIADLGEEHGHQVLRVCGKGTKVVVLVPLPPAVGRAIDRAIGSRMRGPVLLNRRGARMDRHAATRRLHQLAEIASVQVTRAHPHMLRHPSRPCSTLVLTSGMSRSPPVTPIRAPLCATTGPARTWTVTRTTSSPPTWPPAPDPVCVSRDSSSGRRPALPMSGRRLAVVSAEAEGVTGWVEEHADVLLRLVRSHRCSEGNGLGDRGVEVAGLEVEVHHRTLLPAGWRPYGGLVAGRLLEHGVDGSRGRGEDRRTWFLVPDGPAEQPGVEPRQCAGVRRLDRGSPPHALLPGLHLAPHSRRISLVKGRSCRAMISMPGQVPDVLLPDLLAGAAKPDASPTSNPGITPDWLGGKRGICHR